MNLSDESRISVRVRDGWMYGEYRDGPFITDEQARGMAEQMCQRAAVDPLFAEECESLFESMRFLIRYDGETRRIICECCGTLVVNVLECLVSSDGWTRAIWEHETGRKHTLRRCEWKRERAPGD